MRHCAGCGFFPRNTQKRAIFLEKGAFFLRDFEKHLLIIKELSANCTVCSAQFFF